MDRPGSSNVSPMQTAFTSKAFDNWEIVFCYLGDVNVYANMYIYKNEYIYICKLSSQITIRSEWRKFYMISLRDFPSPDVNTETVWYTDLIWYNHHLNNFIAPTTQHRYSVTPFPNCHRGQRRWGVTKDTTESHSPGKRQLALILRHSVEIRFV